MEGKKTKTHETTMEYVGNDFTNCTRRYDLSPGGDCQDERDLSGTTVTLGHCKFVEEHIRGQNANTVVTCQPFLRK